MPIPQYAYAEEFSDYIWSFYNIKIPPEVIFWRYVLNIKLNIPSYIKNELPIEIQDNYTIEDEYHCFLALRNNGYFQ